MILPFYCSISTFGVFLPRWCIAQNLLFHIHLRLLATATRVSKVKLSIPVVLSQYYKVVAQLASGKSDHLQFRWSKWLSRRFHFDGSKITDIGRSTVPYNVINMTDVMAFYHCRRLYKVAGYERKAYSIHIDIDKASREKTTCEEK